MGIVFVDNNPGGFSSLPDAPGGSIIGPFKVGTNLYIIAQGDSFGPDIVAYKSTDNGATWTGPVNPGTDWTISGYQGWWSAYFTTGTKIYACWYSNPGPNLQVAYFDTATDSWSAALFVNRPIPLLSNDSGAVSGYKDLTTRPGAFVIRSDGSFVMPNIQMENVGGFKNRTNVNFYTAAGAVISENNLCGQNGAAVHDVHAGTVLGAADRTHVFYVEYGGKTLQHRTITSANVIQAAQQVANDIFDPGGVNTQSLIESIGIPAYSAATGEIAIPYKDVNGNLKIARATSVDAPVWTTEQVQNSIVVLQHGQATGSNVSAAYYDVSTGNLSVAFLDNQIAPAIVNIYRCTKSSGAWGAPELLTATGIPSGGGTIIQSLHALSLSSVSLVFYTPDGGGLNYIIGYMSASAPAPPATPVYVAIAVFSP